MAQYIKQEIRDVTNKDAKRVYYRIASRGNVGQEDLLNEMCAHGRTGLNRGNVKAVLTLLAETMQYFLTQGYSAGMKELGDQFGMGEIFLPELIFATEVMKTVEKRCRTRCR